MRALPALLSISLIYAAACAVAGLDPAAPSLEGASSWGPESPPFNDEIILRDVSDGRGFGHVKFRQPNDGNRIVYLDTWVRDLKPNATYQLQRATDTAVHDDCLWTDLISPGWGGAPPGNHTDDPGNPAGELFPHLGTPP